MWLLGFECLGRFQKLFACNVGSRLNRLGVDFHGNWFVVRGVPHPCLWNDSCGGVKIFDALSMTAQFVSTQRLVSRGLQGNRRAGLEYLSGSRFRVSDGSMCVGAE